MFCPHLVSTRIPALRRTVVLLQCIMSKVGMSSRKPAKSQSTHTRSSISNGLKEIHIDEEVKIAVNLSLERFRYSDHKGINCSFCIYIFFFLNHVLVNQRCDGLNIYPFLSMIEQRWNFPPPCPVLRGLSFIEWPSPSVTFLRAKGKFP